MWPRSSLNNIAFILPLDRADGCSTGHSSVRIHTHLILKAPKKQRLSDDNVVVAISGVGRQSACTRHILSTRRATLSAQGVTLSYMLSHTPTTWPGLLARSSSSSSARVVGRLLLEDRPGMALGRCGNGSLVSKRLLLKAAPTHTTSGLLQLLPFCPQNVDATARRTVLSQQPVKATVWYLSTPNQLRLVLTHWLISNQ